MTNTSVIRQEDKILFCYVNTAVVPVQFITRPDGSKFVNSFYDSWFSSANKYPVKGSIQDATMKVWELKMRELNFDFSSFEKQLSEGIQIPYDAVEIEKDYSGCSKENMIPIEYAFLVDDTPVREKEKDVLAEGTPEQDFKSFEEIWREAHNLYSDVTAQGTILQGLDAVRAKYRITRIATKHSH